MDLNHIPADLTGGLVPPQALPPDESQALLSPESGSETESPTVVCGGETSPAQLRRQQARAESMWRLVLCGLLCAGAVACRLFWPGATEVLRDWVVGTGDQPLQVAANSFDQALQDGRPVQEAVAVFCDEITGAD